MTCPSFYARLNSGKSLILSLVLIVTAALLVTAIGMSPRLAPVAPAQETPPADARVEVFALTPEGFEPVEATLPAGNYLLVFNNRTGLDEFALRIERERQGAVSEARSRRRERSLRQMIRLTPGTYVIAEASHPDWTLRLRVTPR